MAEQTNKSPAFQFYPKDWITDINVCSMSNSEKGIYFTLLCHDWLENGLTEEQIILLSKEPNSNQPSALVRGRFEPHPERDGFFTNPRLQKEREKQQRWKKKSSDAGKKSAEKRKQATVSNSSEDNQSPTNVQPKGQPNTNFTSTSTSTSTSTDIIISNNKVKRKPKKIPLGDPPSPENDKIPVELQELFKSQGKTEQIKNVWVTDAECDRLQKKWGTENLCKGMESFSRWSLNLDINPKTKIAGWESFRLKRDHASSIDNLLKRMELKGELAS